MIDHLLVFTSEAEALASKDLRRWRIGAAEWNRAVTFPGVKPKTNKGAELPGWWIIVALEQVDKVLASSAACVVVCDRDADSRGAAFIHNSADAPLKLDALTLESIAVISGKPAGARYEADSFQSAKIAAATE